MEDIGVHWCCIIKPTFWERMFPIIFLAFISTLSAIILICNKSKLHAEIHVPDFTVTLFVSILECRPKLIVRQGRMATNY
jgi:hypothetical protein